jgi:hypothetical protein
MRKHYLFPQKIKRFNTVFDFDGFKEAFVSSITASPARAKLVVRGVIACLLC